MIRLGLVGYPLEYSLSPTLHEAALEIAGLQGVYSLYRIDPGDTAALGNLIDHVRTGELTGLNVTIPHKQAVMQFLDELSPTARAIGAVNTIYCRDGKVLGENTDAPGFLSDLRAWMPMPQSALVLGAGGAARAAAYALASAGCEVVVAARRMDQAGELATMHPDIKAVTLEVRALQEAGAELIVNATPAGMQPNVHESPWPAGVSLPHGAAVYDLIYSPRETRLMREARTAGLRATGGLGMLIEQAALAFEIWTGCNTRREVLLDSVRQAAH